MRQESVKNFHISQVDEEWSATTTHGAVCGVSHRHRPSSEIGGRRLGLRPRHRIGTPKTDDHVATIENLQRDTTRAGHRAHVSLSIVRLGFRAAASPRSTFVENREHTGAQYKAGVSVALQILSRTNGKISRICQSFVKSQTRTQYVTRSAYLKNLSRV